jgi:hypothetical protein
VVNKSSIARDLENKEKKPESIAKKVIRDPELLSVLLDGFCSSIAGVRFKSAKTLVLISEQQPDILYPYFDFFSDNLTNRNNILKWNAIDVLACLTRVDTKNRFDELFERFYGMLKEGALITAAHVIASSAVIATAKPHLEKRITEMLLKLDAVPLPTQECKNILKGHAIETFGRYFDQIREKEKVVEFVKRELKNRRAATRRKAERFLKKWAG